MSRFFFAGRSRCAVEEQNIKLVSECVCVCERVCAPAGRERRSGRTTAGLVEVAHLQHAAKLRLHSWRGANGLFGSKCSRISFQGVQYILVTCIRFFFLSPPLPPHLSFFFLKRTNKPMLWLRKSSDKLPLRPCPTRLIKYPNWGSWTAGKSSLTVWWDCKRSLFFLINVGAFNSHAGSFPEGKVEKNQMGAWRFFLPDVEKLILIEPVCPTCFIRVQRQIREVRQHQSRVPSTQQTPSTLRQTNAIQVLSLTRRCGSQANKECLLPRRGRRTRDAVFPLPQSLT